MWIDGDMRRKTADASRARSVGYAMEHHEVDLQLVAKQWLKTN
jgi:hypothetical protein